MIQIRNRKELDTMIQFVEIEQAHKQKVLKEQFHATYESLKPLNILKNSIKEVVSTPEIGTSLVDSAIGMATGYLSNKILVGNTHNPIKGIVGSLIQMLVGNVVSRHTGGIISTGKTIVKLLSAASKKSNRYPNYH